MITGRLICDGTHSTWRKNKHFQCERIEFSPIRALESLSCCFPSDHGQELIDFLFIAKGRTGKCNRKRFRKHSELDGKFSCERSVIRLIHSNLLSPGQSMKKLYQNIFLPFRRLIRWNWINDDRLSKRFLLWEIKSFERIKNLVRFFPSFCLSPPDDGNDRSDEIK